MDAVQMGNVLFTIVMTMMILAFAKLFTAGW